VIDNPDFFVGINPATYMYNTELDPIQERGFQSWAKKISKKLGRNVLNDLEGYDLRAHYLSGGGLAANNHMSDIGKKPNHPTFSDESKYSTIGREGGSWREGNFVPSYDMMRDDRKINSLMRYLNRNEGDYPMLSPYVARRKGK